VQADLTRRHGDGHHAEGGNFKSKAFFARSWPQYELDGLVTMANSGRQVILPLWHGLSRDEVIAASPSLADRVALRTSDSTIQEIANEIAAVIAR
jgi:hypothetical protein